MTDLIGQWDVVGGSLEITAAEMSDRRPTSSREPKLAALRSMSLPHNCSGRINVIDGKNEVVFWAWGDQWGPTIHFLLSHVHGANAVRVENGLAKIVRAR